jgi:hypothetical protein
MHYESSRHVVRAGESGEEEVGGGQLARSAHELGKSASHVPDMR